MKIIIFSLVVVLSSNSIFSQNIIDWDSEYKLKFSDYQSSATEIDSLSNSYMINSGVQMNFSFAMSGYEFMFTKNFNSKVQTVFFRDQASIVASNMEIVERLVDFGQYEFDLNELYSRKLRKALYENKGAFSSVDFFKPIYDSLRASMSKRHTVVGKESDIGNKVEILRSAQQKVLNEIKNLSDFCRTCKPPKQKKKKAKK